MDTSKEFIEMCAAAEEIQGLHKKYDQTLSIIPNLYARYKDDFGAESIIPPEGQGDSDKIEIWLPRQDQLQDMCISYVPEISFNIKEGINGRYIVFYTSNGVEYVVDSFEQAWLMVAMRQYKKEWNRETKKWEVIK